jgi:hypothetical protein
MTSKALAESNDLEPEGSDLTIDARASAALSDWLREHQVVARELEEAGQVSIHRQEVDARAETAEAAADDAARRAASTAMKLDPGGYRVLRPFVGGALVTGLVILDIFPLNWAAQAFNLDASASWLVTIILLTASVAAMAGLELSRQHRRRRVVLMTALLIVCVALVLLRTEFLAVVTSATLWDAFLQSLLLTAISAGLVLSGSMVLGRTRSLRLASARAVARRAQREADAARIAKSLAQERLQRHFGALRQMLIPWALSSPAPKGIDRVSWTAALERAVRRLVAGL